MPKVALLISDPSLYATCAASLRDRAYDLLSLGPAPEVDAILNASPDLVLLAANPTALCDLDLVAHLRRTLSRERLPIVLLSGGREEDFRRGFAADVTDCLSVTVSQDVLMAKVSHFLKLAALASAKTELPQPGQTVLGRYQIQGVLGKGSYGAVFRARDLELGRPVALKVLMSCEGSELRARFMREAYSLGAIKSPYVAEILDFGERPEFLYVAMELVEGPTLRDRVLREGACQTDELANLLRGMTEAVQASHLAGFCHRDVKPANFVLRGGRYSAPVLIDFGLAKCVFDSAVTSADIIMGTPGYMAPEVLQRDADERSDLYSLGQCAVFAARGHEWLSELSGFALLRAAAERRVPIPLDLPEALQRILSRLTEIEPESRYESARQALEALEPYQKQEVRFPPARLTHTLPPERWELETARSVRAGTGAAS